MYTPSLLSTSLISFCVQVIEHMELMLTQKECEHASITSSAEEDAFLQEELVGQIDTLESLLISGHVSLGEKQNKHHQMEYTEDLGILNQYSPYITLRFNLLAVSPVEDENSTPLFRGLPEEEIFGSITMRDIRVYLLFHLDKLNCSLIIF
ncbi:unnamed protein product [Trichobilharzia regenti]|nr:unnamed protein product [Trichobilharzia regenti]